MTLRYAATLAATAEAEFLKHKKIGAHGVDIQISPADIYDMTQLHQRTDRVLPNGVCLLPPLKSCDKGNGAYPAGISPPTPPISTSYATNTHKPPR